MPSISPLFNGYFTFPVLNGGHLRHRAVTHRRFSPQQRRGALLARSRGRLAGGARTSGAGARGASAPGKHTWLDSSSGE